MSFISILRHIFRFQILCKDTTFIWINQSLFWNCSFQLIGAVSSVRPQIAILYELAQITFGEGGVETEIIPHGLRLQGYTLSSNHPFVQLIDGEYQVPVAPPRWCRIWKGFPYYAFFRNELFRDFTLQNWSSTLLSIGELTGYASVPPFF